MAASQNFWGLRSRAINISACISWLDIEMRLQKTYHPPLRNRLNICDLCVGVLSKVVCQDDIHRQDEFNAQCFCISLDTLGKRKLIIFHERLPYLQACCFEEGEDHATPAEAILLWIDLLDSSALPARPASASVRSRWDCQKRYLCFIWERAWKSADLVSMWNPNYIGGQRPLLLRCQKERVQAWLLLGKTFSDAQMHPDWSIWQSIHQCLGWAGQSSSNFFYSSLFHTNVKTGACPTMILLTRSVSDVSTGIFVETFEPPTIATKGLCGSLTTPSKYFNSCTVWDSEYMIVTILSEIKIYRLSFWPYLHPSSRCPRSLSFAAKTPERLWSMSRCSRKLHCLMQTQQISPFAWGSQQHWVWDSGWRLLWKHALCGHCQKHH